MKTYNKNPEAVSQLTPDQFRVTQHEAPSDRSRTNTGTITRPESTSTSSRANRYSRPR